MADKILIVEDEPVWQRLYQMCLATEGSEVEIATNGEEALAILKNRSLDLIILDLELEQGTGLEYLQKFMSVEHNVKIVSITGTSDFHWDFRSWAADAVVTRSDDLSALKATIERVLHSERKQEGNSRGQYANKI